MKRLKYILVILTIFNLSGCFSLSTIEHNISMHKDDSNWNKGTTIKTIWVRTHK